MLDSRDFSKGFMERFARLLPWLTAMTSLLLSNPKVTVFIDRRSQPINNGACEHTITRLFNLYAEHLITRTHILVSEHGNVH